ncbi:hypothetical protein ACH47B_01885 [Rhodococcus sp. NPDC019627]|uniref:hypothetical protein n=1 Tax=unclassified Rhodococcus (in: high G+C Gram-positive bacteria) TaxID=192944 RepID=UPI0033D9C6B4
MLPGSRRALGALELPDDLRILDLDDPAQLVPLGLRPTQVVTRNLTVAQGWGHRIWSETEPQTGGRAWQAVSWWSYHRRQWSMLTSWLRPELVRVEPLDLEHPAILDSAKAVQCNVMICTGTAASRVNDAGFTRRGGRCRGPRSGGALLPFRDQVREQDDDRADDEPDECGHHGPVSRSAASHRRAGRRGS